MMEYYNMSEQKHNVCSQLFAGNLHKLSCTA